MAQVINTNTMSLNAQRNLSSSGASLATTIQRLSSGLRINSAKDDAAGLAISERFGTQIRGLDVAVRNANDAISLAQTAEGALTEVGNNLQRIRELSVQSANATNSASDRKALQAEVTQLVSEIDRVAKQSEFNGTKLLDGSFSAQLFQIGANAGQAIAIDKVVNAKADAMGDAKFDTQMITIAAGADSAADAGKTITFSGLEIGGGSLTSPIKIDDVQVVATGVAATDRAALATAVSAAINAKFGETGVRAEMSTTAGEIVLSSAKENVDSTGAWSAMTVTAGTSAGVTGYSTVAVDGTAAASASQMLADINIDTAMGAQRALEVVDKALGSVNSVRADLGAIQNRFNSVVTNLQASSENLSTSRGRIRDTDFAKETAELTRTQILQQAGTAMLAQANQVPQNVLSLLR